MNVSHGGHEIGMNKAYWNSHSRKFQMQFFDDLEHSLPTKLRGTCQYKDIIWYKSITWTQKRKAKSWGRIYNQFPGKKNIHKIILVIEPIRVINWWDIGRENLREGVRIGPYTTVVIGGGSGGEMSDRRRGVHFGLQRGLNQKPKRTTSRYSRWSLWNIISPAIINNHPRNRNKILRSPIKKYCKL